MLDDLVFPQESKEAPVALHKDSFKGVRGGEWVREHWIWGNYASLVDLSAIDLEAWVEAIKEGACEVLGLGSTYIQEGFIARWLSRQPPALRNPTVEQVEKALAFEDVVVLCDLKSEIYGRLKARLPDESQGMCSALCLEDPERNRLLFLLISTADGTERLFSLLASLREMLSKYRLSKGWPQCTSGEYMVTTVFKHPLYLVSRAYRQCCEWFLMTGPHENLALRGLDEQLSNLGSGFVALSGQHSSDGQALLVGMDEYPNFQDSPIEKCLEWRRTRGGLMFARFESEAWASLGEACDGFLFDVGNSEYIDAYEKPFLAYSHRVARRDVPCSMVLLVEKERPLSKETVIDALLKRNCIAICDGRILGPKQLRDLFSLLVLERRYLEDLFSSKVSVETEVVDGQQQVELRNASGRDINGTIVLRHPAYITLGLTETEVSLKSGESRRLVVPIEYGSEACGRYNAIETVFDFHQGVKRDISYFHVPPVIATHSESVVEAGEVELEATVFNHRAEHEVTVRYKLHSGSGLGTEGEVRAKAEPKHLVKVPFWARLEPGSYRLELSALNSQSASDIVAVHPQGSARAEEANLHGTKVVLLENDVVEATIIPIGGRLIDYRLKDPCAALLFRLWPKKPSDWRRPWRRLAFWPYGGLEEFIQQPTVETHEPFNLRIVKGSGGSAVAIAEADIRGNKITKRYTLFAGSPLLEVNYQFEFVNPELNVVGVNPIIKLGEVCDRSHVFYFPTKQGIEERRFLEHRMYGECFNLEEGWVACYDEVEKLTLITGFDVEKPYLVHFWENTPQNYDSHYYYVEIQPWIRTAEGQTNYFTYYLYGCKGDWRDAVEEFRKIGMPLKRPSAYS